MAIISPAPFLQFFDPTNGDFLAGGKVYTYVTGTSTPATTYTNSGGSIAHANPIILDAAGAATVYLPAGSAFRFVITDADDATIDTVDGIIGYDDNGLIDAIDTRLATYVVPVTLGGTGATTVGAARTALGIAYPYDLAIACSDETTDIVAGANVVRMRAPRAFACSKIWASLNTASASGGPVTVDVSKNGSSVFSTVITIDDTESSSLTATVPPVISGILDFAEGDIIGVDIDVDGTGAKGLKVYLIGTVAA
jgi:hypothetical protein